MAIVSWQCMLHVSLAGCSLEHYPACMAQLVNAAPCSSVFTHQHAWLQCLHATALAALSAFELPFGTSSSAAAVASAAQVDRACRQSATCVSQHTQQLSLVSACAGRKGRLVRQKGGTGVKWEARNASGVAEGTMLDLINVHERELFLDGTKLVAVISEAASAGISLHADRSAFHDLDDHKGCL